MYLLLLLCVGTCAGKMWIVETKGYNTEAGSNQKVTNIAKLMKSYHARFIVSANSYNSYAFIYAQIFMKFVT